MPFIASHHVYTLPQGDQADFFHKGGKMQKPGLNILGESLKLRIHDLVQIFDNPRGFRIGMLEMAFLRYWPMS